METKCCIYKETVSVLLVQTTAGAQRVQCLQLLIASTVVTGVFKRNCLGLKTSVTSNFGYYNVAVAERTAVLLQACRQLQSCYYYALLQSVSTERLQCAAWYISTVQTSTLVCM